MRLSIRPHTVISWPINTAASCSLRSAHILCPSAPSLFPVCMCCTWSACLARTRHLHQQQTNSMAQKGAHLLRCTPTLSFSHPVAPRSPCSLRILPSPIMFAHLYCRVSGLYLLWYSFSAPHPVNGIHLPSNWWTLGHTWTCTHTPYYYTAIILELDIMLHYNMRTVGQKACLWWPPLVCLTSGVCLLFPHPPLTLHNAVICVKSISIIGPCVDMGIGCMYWGSPLCTGMHRLNNDCRCCGPWSRHVDLGRWP